MTPKCFLTDSSFVNLGMDKKNECILSLRSYLWAPMEKNQHNISIKLPSISISNVLSVSTERDNQIKP